MRSEPRISANERGDAFRRHVVPELAVLLRVARRLTGSTPDAEDLVQETLIRAYRAVDRFDGRHPRAWLLTIMRNTWRNMNRRRRPRLLHADERIDATPAQGADGRHGVEDQVLGGMLDADLADALNGLSASHRAVVLLVDVDGLSYSETAEALGVPQGTVMSRLHRARRKMRAHLERRGHQLAEGSERPSRAPDSSQE